MFFSFITTFNAYSIFFLKILEKNNPTLLSKLKKCGLSNKEINNLERQNYDSLIQIKGIDNKIASAIIALSNKRQRDSEALSINNRKK